MQLPYGHGFWRTLVVSGVAVAVAVLPTAAFGQTLRHTDRARDVVKVNTRNGTHAPAGTNKTADLVHLRFTHSRFRVIAKIRLRDCCGDWVYYGRIETPTSEYTMHAQGGPGFKTRFELRFTNSEFGLVCDGLSAKVRPAKNTLRVSVPRMCLDRPRWVRMGVGFVVFTSGSNVFYDDGLRRKGADVGADIVEDAPANVKLSSRLHRN
jgi:hypothetical protein